MVVSDSSGLNLPLLLFLRLVSPCSTNLSLVLPSLICLIPAQNSICCLQGIPVGFDNIYISSVRKSERNKAEGCFWIPHLAEAALQFVHACFMTIFLLSHLHSSCPHTLLAHVHPVFFTNLGFDSCTEKCEFCHQFPWDQTQSAFVTKGDWHAQHSIFHWK